MDQKTISTGGVLTIVVYLFIGAITLPLGITCLARYPETIWPVGLFFLACTIGMIYAAVITWRTYKRFGKEEALELNVVKKKLQLFEAAASKGKPASANPEQATNILAHWIFSFDEWRQFRLRERMVKRTSTGTEMVVLLLGGAALIHFILGENWEESFAISIAVCLVYWAAKYLRHVRRYKRTGENVDVVITDHSVIINDHLMPFLNDQYWIAEAYALEGVFPIIEITYCWNTSKGVAYDEIRIPIPADKMEEAKRVAAALQKRAAELIA